MNIFERQLIAHQLASAFVQQNADLNAGIAKVATEKDLSRVQIQGLVTAVNHAANDTLRKSAEDKTYTFALAELDKVVELLSDIKPTGVDWIKTASAIDDAVAFPDRTEYLEKVASTMVDANCASRAKEAADIMLKFAELLDAHKRRVTAERSSDLLKFASVIDSLTQQIKNYLGSGMYSFETIQKYAASVLRDAPKVADTLMNKVASMIEKTADPCGNSLITRAKDFSVETFKRTGSPVPPVGITIHNGKTALQQTLVDAHKQMLGISEQDKLVHEMDSLRSFIVGAERVFRDSNDVNQYLLNELNSMYRAVATKPVLDLDKVAAVANMLRGAKIVGGLAGSGAKTLAKGYTTLTGKGVLGAAAMAGGAAAMQATGLKAGQATLNKARKGISYSKGTGAADSGNTSLQ